MQTRRLLAYPLLRLFGHLDMATVQQGSVVALLLTANILPLALRTRSWATVHRRAANLAVINFHYVPFLAACSMVLIVPVTLHAVVRRYPQPAMKAHYLLGAIGLASISYHVWMRQSKCLWCLVAAAALWIFLTLVSLAVPLRRCWGHSWPSVVISRHHELLSIDITVPSGWRVEPGQYVYLWLPQAGLRLASQLLLLYVSSWEDTLTSKLVHLSGQRAQIYASEQSASQEDTLSDASLPSAEHGGEWRQAGTARHISRGRTSSNTAGYRTLCVLPRPRVRHSALVLGPYGRPPDLARFGIVLLIIQDIGITRVFSLIQTLVLASEQHRAMVRKLIVVWQMEDLGAARQNNPSCLP
ncbi:hypothetical protein BDW75DRAFT_235286 [Aspergillus navahoensis]